MLPDVAAEHRMLPVHDGTVLIRRAFDRDLPRFVAYQPRPAAPEPAQARFLELLLEGRETSEGRVDRRGEPALRFGGTARRHQLPEERVVVMPAAVVADRGPNRLRHFGEVSDQRIEGQALQRGLSVQGGVEVGDVGLMVLPVMDPHGLLVNVRLQRVVVEWQRRESERHEMLQVRRVC